MTVQVYVALNQNRRPVQLSDGCLQNLQQNVTLLQIKVAILLITSPD